MSLGPLPLVQTVAGWSLDGEDGDGMPGCEAPVPAGLRWRTPLSRDQAHSPASLGGNSGNVGRDSSFENQLVPGMLTALCLLHEIKCAKVV